jgi:predicted nucleic acid-binding protein
MPARVSPARAFFDTSVLVYVVTDDDWRSEVAASLLRRGGVVSVQVLNEFVSVLRKKMRQSWDTIQQDLSDIRTLCNPALSVTLSTHEAALRIAQRYGYQIYDS